MPHIPGVEDIRHQVAAGKVRGAPAGLEFLGVHLGKALVQVGVGGPGLPGLPVDGKLGEHHPLPVHIRRIGAVRAAVGDAQNHRVRLLRGAVEGPGAPDALGIRLIGKIVVIQQGVVPQLLAVLGEELGVAQDGAAAGGQLILPAPEGDLHIHQQVAWGGLYPIELHPVVLGGELLAPVLAGVRGDGKPGGKLPAHLVVLPAPALAAVLRDPVEPRHRQGGGELLPVLGGGGQLIHQGEGVVPVRQSLAPCVEQLRLPAVYGEEDALLLGQAQPVVLVPLLPRRAGDPQGEVDIIPVAEGLVQGEAVVRVRRGRGGQVQLLHAALIGAHVGAHGVHGVVVHQGEQAAQAGDALGEGGVGGVEPQQPPAHDGQGGEHPRGFFQGPQPRFRFGQLLGQLGVDLPQLVVDDQGHRRYIQFPAERPGFSRVQFLSSHKASPLFPNRLS